MTRAIKQIQQIFLHAIFCILGCSLFILFRIGFSDTAVNAHGISGKATHHYVVLTVNGNHLDIEIDLQLSSALANIQRRLIDKDVNGVINTAEKVAYLNQMVEVLGKGFFLKIDGVHLSVFELYPPEINFLNNNLSGSHPLLLRFFYQLEPPKTFGPKSIIEFEDQLWQDTDSFFSLQIRSDLEPKIKFYEAGVPRIFRFPWAGLSDSKTGDNTP